MIINDITITPVYERITQFSNGRIGTVSDWSRERIATVNMIIDPVERIWMGCFLPYKIIQPAQVDLPLTQELIDTLVRHRYIFGIQDWQLEMLNKCLAQLNEPSTCECG